MKTDIEIIHAVLESTKSRIILDAPFQAAMEAGITLAAILEVHNGGVSRGDYEETRIRRLMSENINRLLSSEPDLAVEYLLNNFRLVDHQSLFFKNKFKVYEPTDINTFPNLVKKRRSGLMTDKEMNRFCRDQPAAANLLASCVVHDLSDRYAALIEQPNFKKNMSKDQVDRVVDSLIKSGLKRNALMDQYKLGIPSVSSRMAVLIGLFSRAAEGKNTDNLLPSALCGEKFVRDYAHHIVDELKEHKFIEPGFVLSVIQEFKRLDVDLVIMAKVLDGGRYAYFDCKDREQGPDDMKEVLDIAWSWRGIKGLHFFTTAFMSLVPMEIIQAHADSQKIIKLRYEETGDRTLLKLINDRRFKGQALEGSMGL
jgi:hypothetical protein